MGNRKTYIIQNGGETYFAKFSEEQVNAIKYLEENGCMSGDFLMDALSDILFEEP